MAPKFGTSGLRGLAVELTPDLISSYVTAFILTCPIGKGLFVGRDLRDSSPRILNDVIAAARAAGIDVTDCGTSPTPALALASLGAGAAAIMITGSHIPADRNGLKFYTPQGEITKSHEAAIISALGAAMPSVPKGGLRYANPGPDFVERYVTAFGPYALAGRRIGVWSHSAVGRDLLMQTLNALGANVVEVGRSGQFIPIDTEAVSDETRAFLVEMARAEIPDSIVSTDGDGDRPLVTDATGTVIPGDILGQITSRLLGADVVVTPVSSNTGAEASGVFDRVVRTKIGSPFVIGGIEATLEKNPRTKVVGYEANGGFLLGFDAAGPAGMLPALMTRDSHLPIIALLVAAGKAGLAERVAAEPVRFTAADRLENVPTKASLALVSRLSSDAEMLRNFLSVFDSGQMIETDLTDGLRVTLESGRIVHLRPSGNAPEMRLYTEAERHDISLDMLSKGLAALRKQIS